ncbi:aminoglycoside adenylyltransferase family protein [Pedobacter sp. SYP-B3415]|uniref:aminoglycoside adenylyltransferase family protein n=1 Tax=Pedobacter sp. SYP-B3415 TaxID=2496641 RepID=UPI00101C9029|nr:aminoglycoside adenylyltransferase family protein [Pedobacter sp. SYP-B3415]
MSTPIIPPAIAGQVKLTCNTIMRFLSTHVRAIHLYGSAAHGNMAPQSDIDLFVTIGNKLTDVTRHALMLELLNHSAPPKSDAAKRALEVTVVSEKEIMPWRSPAIREMQFGEWLRNDLAAGIIEPELADIDLGLLLTQIREHSIPVFGPPAETFFEPVPHEDVRVALAHTLGMWQTPEDWAGDEQNIVLAIARIWYTARTGKITAKELAAGWLLTRLPDEHRSVLREAVNSYLTGQSDNLSTRPEELGAFIRYAQSHITYDAF